MLAAILADLDGGADDLRAALAAAIVVLLRVGRDRANALFLGLDGLDRRCTIGRGGLSRARKLDVLRTAALTRCKARVIGLLLRARAEALPLPP